MATIKEYVGKKATTYYVFFRMGGRGSKQTSEAFDNPKSAEKFKAAVEAFGPDAALQMLEQGRTVGRTVDELFVDWLEHKRADMTSEAHRDYERQYEKWIKPTFGWRDAELVTEKDVQA